MKNHLKYLEKSKKHLMRYKKGTTFLFVIINLLLSIGLVMVGFLLKFNTVAGMSCLIIGILALIINIIQLSLGKYKK